MTADKPSPLVPNLRFAEFRDAGDWMTQTLENLGGFLSSLTGKTAKDFDRGDATFIPYMNIFSNTFTNIFDLRSVNVGRDESQNAVAKGDVFFTISSEVPEEAGMSSVLLEEIDHCYLNSFCALFRFDDRKSPNPVFLGYLLRSALARAHLSRGAQGATRYNITKATFRSLPLQLPSGPEQQKIADCLGFLDDLVAAEGGKLEALRQHKQGLMQQLFPRPGETVPRLRFPEFIDAPHWRTSTFGERCESFSGSTPDTSNRAYYGGTIPFIRSAEIGKDETEIFLTEEGLVHSAAKMVKRGDLLVALYGANSGDTALARVDGAINQAIMCLRCHDSAAYLYHYLTARKNWIIATYLQGGQGNLSGQIVLSVPLSVPHKDEQEKVADCLSTLDAQIEEQAQKNRCPQAS